jgi:hypothetical protein
MILLRTFLRTLTAPYPTHASTANHDSETNQIQTTWIQRRPGTDSAREEMDARVMEFVETAWGE